MVLMPIELLPIHDQFVSDFSPDDQDDNFVSFDILQGTQVTYLKLELGQRIGAQAFDCFRRCRGLVLQPGTG